MRKIIALLAIAALQLLLSTTAAAQNTLWVTSTASSGPGSLAAAVASMQFNGTTQTIRFQLPQSSVIGLAADLPLLTGSAVEILGADTPGLVIDGAGAFRIFRYTSGSSMLIRDLTLRNGRSTASGCLSSNATSATQAFDVSFINCQTDGTAASGSGGGALFAFGPLRLTRTRFVGNLAFDGGIDNLALGGGAVSFNGGTLLIENSLFEGNYTLRTVRPAGGCFDGGGGAISASLTAGGGATLRGVTFIGNNHRCGSPTGAISGQAGALMVFGPPSGTAPTFGIESSYFGGNRANNGAGIFARAVRLNIVNSSFYDNVGTAGTGAILLSSGFGSAPPPPELNLASTTFWNNGSSSGNSGSDITLVATSGAIVRGLRNVLFGPSVSGANCAPAFFNVESGANNFVAGSDCVAALPGGDVITLEFAASNSFGLQAPALNGGSVPTMDLAPGSVAIDNGSSIACPARDARDFPRPFDGDGTGGAVCDVGAIEYRPELLLQNGFEP